MFFRRKRPPVTSKPLYGVNLGGWLVLEKWITPRLFSMLANDEYTLQQSADQTVLNRITEHRETFITKDDFLWLKSQGIRAVRLPVGHGMFGDAPPYTETVTYVDRAFDWADEAGIKILIDLHTAPGSQNGWQESGQIGNVGWHKNERNIIQTLAVIQKIARRYAGRRSLLGIELLNEPHSKIPRRKLHKYYKAAYRLIRHECGSKVWVVFSDNFKPRRWKRKLRAPQYERVYIDTHQYQAYTRRDRRMRLPGHLKKTLQKLPKKLAKMHKYHRLIVGEWSIVLNPKSFEGLNDQQIRAARSAFGSAQLVAFERADAWFYWTYKTPNGGPWSFRSAIEQGWLPKLQA